MPTTLLDIAKHNLGDAAVGIIEEAAAMHPEITGMHPFSGQTIEGVAQARTIPGLDYSTLVRTSVPTGGSFRSVNAGVTPGKSGWENRLVQTFTFDKRFQCDKAAADRHVDGWQAYLAAEGLGIMEGGMQDLGRQFFYGRNATHADAGGFPGLLDSLDVTDMVVDGGGTTDSVASSVWFVRFGPQDVRHVVGIEGKFDLSDVRVETLVDAADPTKFYDGYVQTLLFYPGLQVGHKYCIGRIKKLTTDSGKGLTDALLGDMLQKFLQKRKQRPTAIFATTRSIEQLRKSRTATTPTGAEAPTPTNFEGIPLVPTDGIKDTETLAL